MARPTKYSEATAKQICGRLQNGATHRDAARSAGVSEDTFRRWITGNAGFAAETMRSEAECAAKMAEIVTTAAVTDWKAALEWLKRRRRDEWGDTVNFSRVPDTELLEYARCIFETRQAADPA